MKKGSKRENAADMRMDKKRGIKEGSARDERMDSRPAKRKSGGKRKK